MAVDESTRESRYRMLVQRFTNLELDQARFREQLHVYSEAQGIEDLLGEELQSESYRLSRYQPLERSPGMYHLASPYKSLLEALGHALFVYSPMSGEMLFWNKAAEDLYGYKKWEVIGECFPYLLAEPEYHAVGRHIMEGLRAGQSWAGQFPFRKRSSEIFMALVNKTPLYEGGRLIGIITVSSDGTVYNLTNANEEDLGWDPRCNNDQPPALDGPPTASSVLSQLSREVRIWSQEDDRNNEEIELDSRDVTTEKPLKTLLPKIRFGALGLNIGKKATDSEDSEKDRSTFTFPQPSKLVSKVRLWSQGDDKRNVEIVEDDVASDKPPKSPPRKGRFGNFAFRIGKNTDDGRISENDNESTFSQSFKLAAKVLSRFRNGNFGRDRDEGIQKNCSVDQKSNVEASYKCVIDTSRTERDYRENHPSLGAIGRIDEETSPISIQESVFSETYPRKSIEFHDKSTERKEVKGLTSSREQKPLEVVYEASRVVRKDYDIGDREIRWEDLQMKEEIGQGSYAVVYRGIWNGSDVAVKLYYVNQFSEELLNDHKKEINIMRKIRHPNVLLYMGAVYSREKIGMVTEYLPRGSLFKILHKKNQALDLKRSLRIALDVAKGVNYLHRRNPPIIHRDLKSSNLLVDRNWTVKVGDFGLSKMKSSTFLTARSGRGTPQWMAPEVLRNERSNEKSDVFSFGVILWELMTRCIPWNNLNPLQVVGVVGFMDRRLDVPDCLDPCIASIIHDCWQRNMEHRPAFEEIIQRMSDIILSIPLASAAKDSDA